LEVKKRKLINNKGLTKKGKTWIVEGKKERIFLEFGKKEKSLI
jgi:hypothetical protein